MRAVGFPKSLPINASESLFDTELPDPEPGTLDLLVRIETISVHPTDAKRRQRIAVDKPDAAPFVLGYDTVGMVETSGAQVAGGKPGDRV